MDHLSGLDATFLYLETPETPMHVGGLNIYELPAGYQGDFLENLREHIAKRMHLAPVFRRKLVNMPFEMANPIWVADDDLDLEYHIRSTVLPKPGNRDQLDKLVGRLHSSQLDRSRPLWEFYVIEGLQTPADAAPGVRHVAFYSKVHHAAVDGEAGVALAQAIMDVSPEPRQVRAAPRRPALASDNFGIAELIAAGLKNSAQQTITRTLAIKINPADKLAPFGALETPDHNATLTATANGTGWALDNIGVTAVEVLVDGQKISEAIYGNSRPDIGAVWGSFPNAVNAGFRFTLNTTELSNGEHRLSVRVFDAQGS